MRFVIRDTSGSGSPSTLGVAALSPSIVLLPLPRRRGIILCLSFLSYSQFPLSIVSLRPFDSHPLIFLSKLDCLTPSKSYELFSSTNRFTSSGENRFDGWGLSVEGRLLCVMDTGDRVSSIFHAIKDLFSLL